MIGLLEGHSLAKAVVVSSPNRQISNSPMHTKEFQILRDPNRPNFELDEQNLGDDNTEEEHEYVDVPLDVQDVHSLHIEVSCSTSGCLFLSFLIFNF